MTTQESQSLKAQCLADLREALGGFSQILCHIDDRLWSYALSIVSTEEDLHNIDEIFAFRKFLRMLQVYDFDYDKVHMVYRAYESLKFSGLKGRQCYRLTPIQCYIFAGIFGFKRDGLRVCRDATLFLPRKFSKTTIAGFIQAWFFMFEDANSEGYCVANSQDQAKILYKMAYDLVHQLDPDERRIRFTATEINWKVGQPREAKIQALSAGGKAKDGMFAQLVTADEYGSAGYVKDHSDMANLLQVMRGSMGPRREPLTVTTTTAGRVNEGPFELRLRQLQADLLNELSIPLSEPRPLDNDWIFLVSLHPDIWEQDEESLQQPRIWRKCNPHVGITVQPDYYANEWKAMRLDEETKREQITKLFNVFQSDRCKTWITADEIRKLQIPKKIDDLINEEGWICAVGMDFSKGDDLNAVSYLCVRWNEETGEKEYFADMDAWISEKSLRENSNHALYQLWYEQGWLRVSPGATINENLVLERLMQVSDAVTIVRFGYDTYDADRFINAISAWIFTQGQDPKAYLTPVSQGYSTYNSPVQEMEYLIRNDPPYIQYSASPVWGWEYQNVLLDESSDGYENKKPIKSGPNRKIDNVQCLLSALWCLDNLEGQIQ